MSDAIGKRVCYIEIETKNVMKQIKDIAIKFNVKRKMGAVQAEADISIANLAKEDIAYLVAINPFDEQNEKHKNKIRLYAGYEDTGYGLIFSGDIWTALPTGKPDTWLNIKARSNFYNNLKIVNINITSPTSTKQLALNIASQLSLPLVWQSTSQKMINTFNYVGSLTKIINKYNKLDNFTMFCDNQSLIVKDKRDTQRGIAIEVNARSGMIGQPEPNCFGVKVKTLLNPTFNCGDWINLKSELIPFCDGLYQIYSMEFQGESRGTPFYCTLDCKNYSVAI